MSDDVCAFENLQAKTFEHCQSSTELNITLKWIYEIVYNLDKRVAEADVQDAKVNRIEQMCDRIAILVWM